MSLLITTDISCDECGNWTAGYAGCRIDGRRARAQARAAGWQQVRRGGERRDLCPTCYLVATGQVPRSHQASLPPGLPPAAEGVAWIAIDPQDIFAGRQARDAAASAARGDHGDQGPSAHPEPR